ncbi:hypothetical protein [Rhizohabitans arisaemae]|uniref:hypothetical protein n=1 Tax=Rhizohabitans arisaemae TaxID=2720610 RepID=UPI0024B23070|nr:hypothetical protein [Rhizohabitans arisaemae]
MDDGIDTDVAGLIYLGLRDGDLDVGSLAEFAGLLRVTGRGDALVDEALRRSAGLSAEEVARLAERLLDLAGFEPGFDLKPEAWPVLRDALDTVERDVRAAGIDGELVLESAEWDVQTGCARVRFRLQQASSALPAVLADRPVRALVEIADSVQGLVTEELWTVWPLCPEHVVGLHPRRFGGKAVWSCTAAGGHVVAPIGELPRSVP